MKRLMNGRRAVDVVYPDFSKASDALIRSSDKPENAG